MAMNWIFIDKQGVTNIYLMLQKGGFELKQ